MNTVKTSNNGLGKYDCEIIRKKAMKNVQLKSNPCHDPKILHGVFKGFAPRAHKICSEHHLKDEFEFLGSKRVLTPQDTNSTEPTTAASQTAFLPWIPRVSPQLKKAFRKAGCKIVFKASQNSILSKKNNVRLQPDSHPGV